MIYPYEPVDYRHPIYCNGNTLGYYFVSHNNGVYFTDDYGNSLNLHFNSIYLWGYPYGQSPNQWDSH